MLLALHITIDVNFDTYLSSICQIVHCKVTLSFLFILYSLQRNHYVPPTLQEQVVILHLLEGRVSTQVIWNFSA